MKMTQAHYSDLLERLKSIPQDKISLHAQAVKESGKFKDFEQRMMWDLFHASKIMNAYSYQEFDYNDCHIETAMKKAIQEAGISY